MVHCRPGLRSSGAAAALRQAGFSEAVKLRDGLGAWEQANLPIQKGTRG
jgi:rhodanese-related sulfurtransferase